MSACEVCWAEANRRVMLLGGSAVDRYRQVLGEQADASVAHALGDIPEPGHPVQTAMADERAKYEPPKPSPEPT